LPKRKTQLALTISVEITRLAIPRLAKRLTACVVITHHTHEVALTVLGAKAVVALLGHPYRLVVTGEGEGRACRAPVLKLKAGGVGGVIATHILRGRATGGATKSYAIKVNAGATLTLIVAQACVAEATRVHPTIQIAEPSLIVLIKGTHLLVTT
jgi:hypothetical protein